MNDDQNQRHILNSNSIVHSPGSVLGTSLLVDHRQDSLVPSLPGDRVTLTQSVDLPLTTWTHDTTRHDRARTQLPGHHSVYAVPITIKLSNQLQPFSTSLISTLCQHTGPSRSKPTLTPKTGSRFDTKFQPITEETHRDRPTPVCPFSMFCTIHLHQRERDREKKRNK